MNQAAASMLSNADTPVVDRTLGHLFYYGPVCPCDELSELLRGLRGLLLAAACTIDNETNDYTIRGEDMRNLLYLAVDIVENAKNHTTSWCDNEAEAEKELKKRAEQLPESDELWVKCNVVADRKLSVVEKTTAIEGMLAQIKPVVITRYDGTKVIVEPHNFKVQKGWSGESIRDGWTPPVMVEEMETTGTNS